MGTLVIQIKGPGMVLRSASLDKSSWEACHEKVSSQKSGGWYNLLEDDFFDDLNCKTDNGKAVAHWHDLNDELELMGALPGRRTIMTIRHSGRKKGFRKSLNQLLEHGMLFPLFHNSVRSIAFDPEHLHSFAVAESRNGNIYSFTWDVPDLELFNPEALEFCWVKVELFGKRQFMLFTEVLYKKQPPKELKAGKSMIKSWEIIQG